MTTLEDKWIRSLLRGIVSAFMICEAIALYEIVTKFIMPNLQFTSSESSLQNYLVWIVIQTMVLAFIEFVTYFKVLRPISRKPLDKQTVTKHWVNVLFFLSFFWGGLGTTGGIVAIALSAMLMVTLETKPE